MSKRFGRKKKRELLKQIKESQLEVSSVLLPCKTKRFDKDLGRKMLLPTFKPTSLKAFDFEDNVQTVFEIHDSQTVRG